MEGHGRSMRGSGRSMRGSRRSMRGSGRSVGGQGVVIGDHLEFRCSLPKEMGISRTEIFRKKKKNKNTKCPIDAHCQCHRRKDFRITKDCNELISNFQLFMLKKRGRP